jgi:hypothetical protein
MEWKWAIYGGDRRRLYLTGKCVTCNADLWAKKSKVGIKRFCSQPCAAIHHRDYGTFECATCSCTFERNNGKTQNSKSGILFCSRKCKDAANRIGGISAIHPRHFGSGKSSYRDRALKRYGIACCNSECPIRAAGIEITERMLDVDHIDENREHNTIENLQVLCIWCHASKTRRENGWKIFGMIV